MPVPAGLHNFGGVYLLDPCSYFKDFSPVLYAQDDRKVTVHLNYFQNAKHKDIFRLLAPGPGAENLRQAGHLSLPGGDQEVRQRRDQCGDRQVAAPFCPVLQVESGSGLFSESGPELIFRSEKHRYLFV